MRTLQPLRPAPRVGIPLDNEEYGIECLVCGTRLHVRRTQIGQTLKCPDCHSPVLVKPPPKREQPKPVEEEEAEMFKLSEPVELPSPVYVPPGTLAEGAVSGASPTTGTPAGPGSPLGGGTAMQNAARAMLEKARAEQEAEEAEERERFSERFTQGLFAFFADPQALGRLAILAVWLAVAMTLFHWTHTIRRDAPAFLGQVTSLAAMVALAFVGLAFLAGRRRLRLALVQDSANGLWKIENWPGANFIDWGLDVFYILNAGFLAALPGAGVGMVLAFVGLPVCFPCVGRRRVVCGLFPPILLSMLESGSACCPPRRGLGQHPRAAGAVEANLLDDRRLDHGRPDRLGRQRVVWRLPPRAVRRGGDGRLRDGLLPHRRPAGVLSGRPAQPAGTRTGEIAEE